MKEIKAAPAAQSRTKNIVFTVCILLAAGTICALLSRLGNGTDYVSMIFILAVFMIARFTDGYLCGIVASVVGVLAVNYIFTYPYFKFNFTLAGYPLAIISMLAVSITTSALTTRTKQSDRLKYLAEREKTKSNLLRAVSHDLRTPLTSILGATSAVIENDAKLTSEARIALLRSAQDDAQWLIRMVENLLTVTRIDAESHAKITKTPEIAEEIVSEAVQKFKKRFPDTAVSASVPREPLAIPMDAILIEQVIINLLENAVLHGKTADKIELTVTKDKEKAVFEVRDNGEGIDQTKLPNIFEGLVSSSQEEGDSKKNMGIGLSVCNTIIKAHGGAMYAFNVPAPGHGAVFRFELDIREDENGY